MKTLSMLVLVACVIAAVPTSEAQTEIPVLQQRVTDFTNSLSYAEWKDLESRLRDFEDSTSTQLAILLVNTIEGGSIEEYSMSVFEKNKLGQKAKDNGVLIVVARQDRKVRIDVGYGLEGVLPDALTSQITTREITPHFKNGEFYEGLLAGVKAIMAASAGEYELKDKGRLAPMTSIIMALFFLGFLGAFILPMFSSKRKFVIGSGKWAYHSGWGWRSGGGGGFGGGSFGGGGFSGGGGMAGGGGSTGSW
ncbi:MAG TPA: hypothetical protein DEP53_07580 [Bacteroidetes bacterium]|nr:hypothetical protein [Bacteroidota bacterium]